MSFICLDCNKDFKFKSHFDRHKNSIKSCKEKLTIGTIIKRELRSIDNKIYNYTNNCTDTLCGFCNKDYSNKNNLQRHIDSYCKIKKDLIDKKNKLLIDRTNNNKNIRKINKKTDLKTDDTDIIDDSIPPVTGDTNIGDNINGDHNININGNLYANNINDINLFTDNFYNFSTTFISK